MVSVYIDFDYTSIDICLGVWPIHVSTIVTLKKKMDSVSKTIKVIKVNCYSTSFSLKKYLFVKKCF